MFIQKTIVLLNRPFAFNQAVILLVTSFVRSSMKRVSSTLKISVNVDTNNVVRKLKIRPKPLTQAVIVNRFAKVSATADFLCFFRRGSYTDMNSAAKII